MNCWKDVKRNIKIVLDSPQTSIFEKILFIRAILDDFERRTSRGKI